MGNRTVCVIVAALLAVSVTAKTLVERSRKPEPVNPTISFWNEDLGLDKSHSETYKSGLNRVMIAKYIPKYSIFTGEDYDMVTEWYVIAGMNEDGSLKLNRICEPYTHWKPPQSSE